ncbi:MAG: hypothetical protein JWO59_1162, partial [Chloroflexi bacterium]|nr:hypothetical protein [Chloroflexota bacterium]
MVLTSQVIPRSSDPHILFRIVETEGKPIFMSRTLVRALLITTLAVTVAGQHTVLARRAHVPAPTITVTPTIALPHSPIQIQGTGFDPSSGGKTVTVSVSLSNSLGTFPIGTLQADSNGAIGGAGSPLLLLPFTVNATGVNQIIASENGSNGLAASQLLTGKPVFPLLNGGQSLAAKQGDQITVRGLGFAPLDVLTVSLGGQPLSGSGGMATADNFGNVTFALTVPQSAQPGNQLLAVTGSAVGAGQRDSASVTLVVAAGSGAVGISPNPAPVGTSVVVQASGFQANEPMTFTLRYFDNGLNNYAIVNSPATADASGNATARISIPGAADSTKAGTVTGRGNNSGIFASSVLPFATLARVIITPATALPGSKITINGSGFIPGENLFLTTRLFKPTIGSIAIPDATGSFSATATLYPTLQGGGAYPLSISGSGGDFASTSFMVAAQHATSLQISPTTAPSGATVSATGQGFGGNEAVALSINGNA